MDVTMGAQLPDIGVSDLAELAHGLALLIPGLLILHIRTQFLAGRRGTHTEEILSYVVVTIIYYAAFLPAFAWALVGASSVQAWFGWVSLIILLPLAVGVGLGVGHQKDWFGRLFRRFGIEVLNPMPSAWDWKFSQRQAQWLIVTLKNGTVFRGWFGRESFASSDVSERDIFIQCLYVAEGDEAWESANKSLLVSYSEISTVEFIDPI